MKESIWSQLESFEPAAMSWQRKKNPIGRVFFELEVSVDICCFFCRLIIDFSESDAAFLTDASAIFGLFSNTIHMSDFH